MELSMKSDMTYENQSKMKWQKGFNPKTDIAVWSDRLHEWDSKKYEKACQKVWDNHGQMFYNRKPEEIEQFLSLYYDEPVILTAIVQETNVLNGYDYWIFYYRKGGNS